MIYAGDEKEEKKKGEELRIILPTSVTDVPLGQWLAPTLPISLSNHIIL